MVCGSSVQVCSATGDGIGSQVGGCEEKLEEWGSAPGLRAVHTRGDVSCQKWHVFS